MSSTHSANVLGFLNPAMSLKLVKTNTVQLTIRSLIIRP